MKPLRKRHLQVWTLLALLIPAGIISAYFAVSHDATGKLLQEDKALALPVLINKIEKNEFTVSLRSSVDKINFQLQWVATKASTLPSSLIYKITNNEMELIGRVEAMGSYYFPLKTDTLNSYRFILYDIIHRQTIDTLNFKP